LGVANGPWIMDWMGRLEAVRNTAYNDKSTTRPYAFIRPKQILFLQCQLSAEARFLTFRLTNPAFCANPMIAQSEVACRAAADDGADAACRIGARIPLHDHFRAVIVFPQWNGLSTSSSASSTYLAFQRSGPGDSHFLALILSAAPQPGSPASSIKRLLK
jgi:hypothetical protein